MQLDPLNPFAASSENLWMETFDPYGDTTDPTSAAFYSGVCGGFPNTNCPCGEIDFPPQ